MSNLKNFDPYHWIFMNRYIPEVPFGYYFFVKYPVNHWYYISQPHHRSVRLWVIHSFLNNPLLGFPEIYSTPVVYAPYALASGSWFLILQYLILLHSVHSYMSFVRNTQNVYSMNAVRLLFLFYLVLEYFKYTNFSVSVFLNLLLLTEFALNIKQFI